MPTRAITSHIDVAQVVLYAFWLFFAGLVYYLRREDKREGYPLQSDRSDKVVVRGLPDIPEPKAYVLPDHGPEIVPRTERDISGLAAPAARFQGAPLQPTGNPMHDGVGPASYAERQDEPDLTFDQKLPKIVPLRVAEGYYLAKEDPDPRGMEVVGADGVVAGVVTDAWIDRSETFVRYLEVEVRSRTAARSRHVLIPMLLASSINPARRRVTVESVTAAQIADAPGIRNPDQVTLREEDRISGYFAGGHMYATPQRLGPVL